MSVTQKLVGNTLTADAKLEAIQAPNGMVMVDNTAVVKTITNAARSTTTATLTSAGHGLKVGQQVVVALLTGPTGFAALNGTYIVTGVATDTFTYTTSTTGTVTTGAATGSATAYWSAPTATGTTEVPLKFPANAVALTVIFTDAAGTYRKNAGGGVGGSVAVPQNSPFTIAGKPDDVAYLISSSGSVIQFFFSTVG